MNIEILKQPYDDDVMRFNEITNHYELTIECVKNNFEVGFKDDGILQKRITKNSRTIYNYLYSRVHTQNKGVVEFFLNRTENGRNFIKDLLMEQMDADLQTGYNDLGNQPAINIATGQTIDRDALYQNMICANAELIADRSEQYCGINLLYQNVFPFIYFKIVRDNQ